MYVPAVQWLLQGCVVSGAAVLWKGAATGRLGCAWLCLPPTVCVPRSEGGSCASSFDGHFDSQQPVLAKVQPVRRGTRGVGDLGA